MSDTKKYFAKNSWQNAKTLLGLRLNIMTRINNNTTVKQSTAHLPPPPPPLIRVSWWVGLTSHITLREQGVYTAENFKASCLFFWKEKNNVAG